MIGERNTSPFTPAEETVFNDIISHGQAFKFTNQDGEEDTIRGVIELHLRDTDIYGRTYFGFEEFRTKNANKPGKKGHTVIIERVAPKFQKLEFKADRRGECVAMCADTKRNRKKLAGHLSSNLWDIHKEHTKEGDKAGSVVMAEIKDMADRIAAERQGKTLSVDHNTERVNRVYKNLTEKERKLLLQKVIEDHNKSLQPVSLDVENPIKSIAELVGEVPPKPKVKEYTALKEAAKKFVYEKNAALIEAIKSKHKNIGVSKEYKDQIVPQIGYVLHAWLEENAAETEEVAAA